MKKTAFFLSAILSLCAMNLSAQEALEPFHFDVRLGIGGKTQSAGSYFTKGSLFSYGSYYSYESLSEIYGDYRGPVKSTGCISAEWTCYVKNKLQVGAYLGLSHLWFDAINGLDDTVTGTEKGAVLYLVPEFRLDYLKRPVVRLYFSVGAGIGKYIGFDSLKYSERTSSGVRYVDKSMKFECQITPLGLEVGRKFYGLLEFGFGTMYSGIRIGAGYKF